MITITRLSLQFTRWRLTLSRQLIVFVKSSNLCQHFATNYVQKALAKIISQLYICGYFVLGTARVKALHVGALKKENEDDETLFSPFPGLSN